MGPVATLVTPVQIPYTHIGIKATCEGLLGGRTSSRYIIDPYVPFIALPAYEALWRHVKITNPLNGKSCVAAVLDVGPWNIHDTDYVLGSARPQSETGTDKFGRSTNHAGIDFGGYVWNHLGMKDNTNVDWVLVD